MLQPKCCTKGSFLWYRSIWILLHLHVSLSRYVFAENEIPLNELVMSRECKSLSLNHFLQGHSIGGCLAALLTLMYKRQGVLLAKNISTIYTFGAPSVFCERPNGEDDMDLFVGSSLAGEEGKGRFWRQDDDSGRSPLQPFLSPSIPRPSSLSSLATSLSSPMDSSRGDGGGHGLGEGRSSRRRQHRGGPSRLMSSLGLRDHTIRNVIMHRDIVPRAFSCDYSPVADILKGWGAGFRDHTSLGYDGRKHLYYFVGRMIVLQPDRSYNTFVANDPDHPMLPPGPGLLYLADPAEMNLPAAQPQVTSGSSTAPPQMAATIGRVPASAHEAVMELMDSPHPLEMLADPNAYLSTGTISR